MQNNSLFKIAILLFLLITTSCSQNPAEVVYGSSSSNLEYKNDSDHIYKSRVNPYKVTVKHGDNLYKISKKYSVSIETLIQRNRLQPPYILTKGENLILPKATFHYVRRGDTLHSISQNYDININNIISANNLKKPYIIKSGTRLRLPVSGEVFVDKDEDYIDDNIKIVSTNSRKIREIKPVVITNAGNRFKEPVNISLNKPISIDNNAPIPILKSNRNQINTNKIRQIKAKNYVNFSMPLRGKIISGFGAKKGGLYNDGINIAAASGSKITAAESGQVVYSGNELRGYGNLLLIKHEKGFITAYAHNKQNLVSKGDYVNKGQNIAYVGDSGHVSTPQLHFSIRKGRKPYDPQKHLNKRL